MSQQSAKNDSAKETAAAMTLLLVMDGLCSNPHSSTAAALYIAPHTELISHKVPFLILHRSLCHLHLVCRGVFWMLNHAAICHHCLFAFHLKSNGHNVWDITTACEDCRGYVKHQSMVSLNEQTLQPIVAPFMMRCLTRCSMGQHQVGNSCEEGGGGKVCPSRV